MEHAMVPGEPLEHAHCCCLSTPLNKMLHPAGHQCTRHHDERCSGKQSASGTGAGAAVATATAVACAMSKSPDRAGQQHWQRHGHVDMRCGRNSPALPLGSQGTRHKSALFAGPRRCKDAQSSQRSKPCFMIMPLLSIFRRFQTGSVTFVEGERQGPHPGCSHAPNRGSSSVSGRCSGQKSASRCRRLCGAPSAARKAILRDAAAWQAAAHGAHLQCGLPQRHRGRGW